jgi:predicted DNA-binding protein
MPDSGVLLNVLKFRLPRALRAELEQLAQDTGHTKSHCVRQAIVEFIERMRRERGEHD